MFTFLNGKPVSEIPSIHRGLSYGDGIFETMRLERGSVALWPYHLARLERGLKRLYILEDIQVIEKEFFDFLDKLNRSGIDSGVIKLRVIRGGETRGYAPEESVENWRIFEVFEGSVPWGQSEDAIISRHKLPHHPELAGIKHLNRLDQVLAAQEITKSSATTALLLNTDGNLVCALDSNIYIEESGQLITPPVNTSGVAGVFRSYMMDKICSDLNMSLIEREISVQQLITADGVWLSNAVKGLRPVSCVERSKEHTKWQKPYSPQMSKLQSFSAKSLGVVGFDS